jgi:lipoprotein-anchoring transpeptidase ErfK/SrfK
LPAAQYQQLLGIMGANPAPSGHGLPVDQSEVMKYSDTHADPPRVASSFTGLLLNGAPPIPMAWMLFTTRAHVLPFQEADHTDTYIARQTPIYLYTSMNMNGVNWYMVGPGQWLDQYNVARVIPATRPAGVAGKWVAVDLTQQVLTAYQDDKMVFAPMVSTGRAPRFTRRGLYQVYLRQLVGDMSALMGTPDGYNIYNVPYIQYFDNGIALHAATWHDNFGSVMSHGCVNMAITDAHWLWNWTADAPPLSVYVWAS